MANQDSDPVVDTVLEQALAMLRSVDSSIELNEANRDALSSLVEWMASHQAKIAPHNARTVREAQRIAESLADPLDISDDTSFSNSDATAHSNWKQGNWGDLKSLFFGIDRMGSLQNLFLELFDPAKMGKTLPLEAIPSKDLVEFAKNGLQGRHRKVIGLVGQLYKVLPRLSSSTQQRLLTIRGHAHWFLGRDVPHYSKEAIARRLETPEATDRRDQIDYAIRIGPNEPNIFVTVLDELVGFGAHEQFGLGKTRAIGGSRSQQSPRSRGRG